MVETTSPKTSLDEIAELAGDDERLEGLLIAVGFHNDQDDLDLVLITRAYHFAKEHHQDQSRKSGEPFIAHCVEVARILAQLRMDHTTIAAGVLHDVIEDTSATYEKVAEQFGKEIAELIAGVTKIDIDDITCKSREERQAETYRKLLIAMFKDIRVIFIKLADRLHNMRTLQYLNPQSRERTSSETLEVYAPLAHHFGMARTRWQLEDLSLKFLEPEIYQELCNKVAMTRREREDDMKKFQSPLEERLYADGIEAEFTSRVKNFYSIYNKMKVRGKSFEEIYDLLAVRIITSTKGECYQILGLVHDIYTPNNRRFKDYISTPKRNKYQSLHTSVIGPKGQYVEVQIRTAEMHDTAEIGIAAHWRYKSNNKVPVVFNLSWLKQFGDWEQDAPKSLEFMENLKAELAAHDEIFVYTPKGDLHQLPKGATPVDFAFAIHTDVGLHCARAKVNDQVVPLSTTLSSGEIVEIVAKPQQKPRLAWLDQVKTAKARQAIRHWLREEQYDHNVRLGKDELDRGLKSYRTAGRPDLDAVAKEFGFSDAEHLYAALGNGDLPVGKVLSRIAPLKPMRRAIRPLDRRDIRIQGIKNLMMQFGKCCNPIPGDEIVGLVSRGRGVRVHRTDCYHIGRISGEPDRLLAVDWVLDDEPAFTVYLRTRSWNRKSLLADISGEISTVGCNIRKATTRTDDHIAEQDFWIDVAGNEQLRQAIDRIKHIEGVLEVQRLDEPANS